MIRLKLPDIHLFHGVPAPEEGTAVSFPDQNEVRRNEEIDRTIGDLRALTASLNALDSRVRRIVANGAARDRETAHANDDKQEQEDDEEGEIVVTPIDLPGQESYPQVWYGSSGAWPAFNVTIAESVSITNLPVDGTFTSVSCIFCGEQARKINAGAWSNCVPSQGEKRPSVFSWWNDDVARIRWASMLT